MDTKFSFPKVNKKKTNDPGTKSYGRGLFIFTLVTVVITVLSAIYMKSVLSGYELFKANEILINQNFAITLDNKFPGSIDEIVIKADPAVEDAYSALIRIQVENAEIVSFSPSIPISIGTCRDGLMFEADKICADLAKDKPFTKGDVLGVMRVRWGQEGIAKIYTTEGHGYFSNELIEDPAPQVAVDISGELPLTGEIAVVKYLNVIGGIFITALSVFLLYRVYKSNKTRHKRLLFIELSITIIGLTLVTIVFVANYQQTMNKYAMIWQGETISELPLTGDLTHSTKYCKAVYSDIPIKINEERVINFEPLPDYASKMWGAIFEITSGNAKFTEVSEVKKDTIRDVWWTVYPIEAADTFKIKLTDDTKDKVDIFLQTEIRDAANKKVGVYCLDFSIPVDKFSETGGCNPAAKGGCLFGCAKDCECINKGWQCPASVPATFEYRKIEIPNFIDVVADPKTNSITVELAPSCSKSSNSKIILEKATRSGVSPTIVTNLNGELTKPIVFNNVTSEGVELRSLRFELAEIYAVVLDYRGKEYEFGKTYYEDKLGDFCETVSKPIDGGIQPPVETQEPPEVIIEPTSTNLQAEDDPNVGGGQLPVGTQTVVQPTIKPAATETPKQDYQAAAEVDKMQCGAMSCKTDSDCETGLPDYECDESSSNWPNNNKCVRVCPPGQTKIGDCSCNNDSVTFVACGQIDFNSDNILDIKDLIQFAKAYNRQCNDTPSTEGCGGKDSNGDKKVDMKDFLSFTKRYHSVAASCKL